MYLVVVVNGGARRMEDVDSLVVGYGQNLLKYKFAIADNASAYSIAVLV